MESKIAFCTKKNERRYTMPYTEAQKRATQKYQAEKQDTIICRYDKRIGFKAALVEHSELTGESMSAFILRACRETMERDRANITKMMRQTRK